MAEGDRTDDMPPGGSDKPRRRPPVIELEATEVGEDGAKASKPKPDPAPASKPEPPESKHATKSAMNLGSLLPIAAAGGAGALAGAAILYFALPQFGTPRAAPDAALVREVASLNARIEAMSKQPAVSPETTALGQRIDKLTAAIAETEKKLAGTEKKPESAPSVPAVTDPGIDSASKELRGALADLRKLAGQTEQQPALSVAIESLSSRIAALDSRVSSLAAAGRSSASSELGREILALNALAAAVQSGKPFAQEFGAVRATSGSKAAALDVLEPSAAKGFPTVATLSTQFSTLAPQLLQKKETNGGFLARLYSNVTSLVEVRRIGEPEGDAPEAVVTRMESLLARGDLAGALNESAKLPEATKAQAAAWIAEAGRRRAADVAVKKLLDDTLLSAEQPKS